MKKLIEILSEDPVLDNIDTGTDKNTIHNYVKGFYENEFLKFQDKEINLLEIGICHGGSLYLWEKYFENANIYGLDITDQAILDRYRSIENVNQLFANAYSQDVASKLPNFDIMIDDGPHSLESQIDFIKLYLPKLNNGGVLVIEDIQRYEHFSILDQFVPEEFKKNIQHVDLRADIGRYDDMMFIVRK